VLRERGEEVLADVARPEGAVAVERDRAARLARPSRVDRLDHLGNGGRLHRPTAYATERAGATARKSHSPPRLWRRTSLRSGPMQRDRAKHISKFLSLGLRHDPSALGIELDTAGWADVSAVLRGLAAGGAAVSEDELEEIVASNDKQRFALSP